VWLQTLTMPGLAHALAPYVGHGSESPAQPATAAVEGGVAGAVLKGLFGGNS